MLNAVDQIKATGQIYNILAPEIVGDYVEKITEPCLNTTGYAKDDIFLCKDDQNVQRLCQALVSISSGQTLLEDTNCKFTTLSDLFKAASASLQPKTLETPINVDGVLKTTVEGALGAINSVVRSLDNAIGDTDISDIGDGTVTGAISEFNTEIINTNNNLAHRNLLDNPWFTINQRNFKTAVNNNYGFDRWIGTYSYNANGVSLSANDFLIQRESNQLKAFANGKYFTASVMLDDGTIYTGTAQYSTSNDVIFFSNDDIDCSSGSFDDYNFSVTAKKSLIIKAVKFELGTKCTIGLDAPPDYAEELAKCRANTGDPSDKFANQGEINVGTPNPNLLDNPWFTVNQRGATQYTTPYAYTLDRWRNLALSEVNVVSGGISLVRGNDSDGDISNYGALTEPLETDLLQKISGKTITLSVMKSDGTIVSSTGVFTYNANYDQLSKTENDINIAISSYNVDHFFIVRNTTKDSALTIKAVKLELGSQSTLAQETSPNYADELAKCKYYYEQLTFSQYGTIAHVDAAPDFATMFLACAEKRTLPVITFSGNLGYVTTGGENIDNAHNAVSQAFGGYNVGGIRTTSGQACSGYAYAADVGGCTIAISAEI